MVTTWEGYDGYLKERDVPSATKLPSRIVDPRPPSSEMLHFQKKNNTTYNSVAQPAERLIS